MENVRLVIGRVMYFGISTAMALIIIGGVIFLFLHANDIVSYQQFHGEPRLLTTFTGIIKDAYNLQPAGIIQLGLLTLFFTQILRVALTVWYFIKDKNLLFTSISTFILFVLVASLLWSL